MALDMHVSERPDDVIASLRANRTLDHVTDLIFQVHLVDPLHAHILRSIEFIAKPSRRRSLGKQVAEKGTVRRSQPEPASPFALADLGFVDGIMVCASRRESRRGSRFTGAASARRRSKSAPRSRSRSRAIANDIATTGAECREPPPRAQMSPVASIAIAT